VNKLRNQ